MASIDRHLVLVTLLASLSPGAWSQQRSCLLDSYPGPPYNNQSVEFSMVGTKNQTGHWTTQFLLNSASPKMNNNWKADVKYYTAEYGGIYTFQIKGVLTVPPPRQSDYEFIPGIGYYKFHTSSRLNFMEASATCVREGGHLAVIDSEDENKALKMIYSRNTSQGPYAYVGFYDRDKKREWITIFDKPIVSLKWTPNKPDNPQAFCGTVHQDGLLGAAVCDEKLNFFCEYDLTWADV